MQSALPRLVALVSSLAAAGCAGSVAKGPPPPPVFADDPGAAPTTEVPGFVRELRPIHVTFKSGLPVRLDALITRPAGNGRLPLVLLSHGSPRGGREYAAVVVMRRGYGRSQGRDLEDSGPCDDCDYSRAARVSSEDVVVTLEALVREPWVDPTRVVLVGQSGGGFASVATGAENPPGVVAVVSFAGGRGSDAPDHVCQPERLVAAMAELGKASHVPSLWVYAANDHFRPALAAQMSAAYAAGGAPMRFVAALPFGEDGHLLFSDGTVEQWWPHVEPFLASLGLPTAVVHPSTATDMELPAKLGASGRRGFAECAASDAFEKAFAAGLTGGWGRALGHRTKADAAAMALANCRKHDDGCVVVAATGQ